MMQVILDQLSDGRSFRQSNSQRSSIRLSQFSIADMDSDYNELWFRNHFHCNKLSFNKLVNYISNEWTKIHGIIGYNTHFLIRDRVAVCLYYLTHSGSIIDSAYTFGMSKTSAIRYIYQVIDIIIQCLGKKYIYLPIGDEWNKLSQGFEAIYGFPDACLAIDGSLFEIEQPADYKGWYCRKGYLAINVQLVVDYNKRIRDYSLWPGSENDKGIYNRSTFGRIIPNLLLPGKVILADAGYQLFTHCMIPYPITDNISRSNRLYNYLHSRSRIVVENTIGLLKGRFRIFLCPLNQKGNENNGWNKNFNNEKIAILQMAKIIKVCLILHNIFIDFGDNCPIDNIMDNNNIEQNLENNNDLEAISGDVAKRRRDIIRNMLWEINQK